MTTETHGMKFVVDTTGVAKGFRDYRSAVEGIFKSLDQFEAHVEKTMKGVASASNNKAALSAFKNAISGYGKVDIDTSAGKKLSSLSAAMNAFKAPSSAQAANTRNFFKALSGIPDLGNVYKAVKSIDDLNIAMRGFKAPSNSQAQNLAKFADSIARSMPKLAALNNISGLAAGAAQINTMSQALGRIKVPTTSQNANLELFAHAMKGFNFANLSGSANLFATLSAIATFKAPNPAQIRNLEAFIKAISELKVPTNANAIAASIANIAHAANTANGSLGGFRTNFGGFPSTFSRFNKGAESAKLNMAGLQNAFSGTFQVGSLVRSLLGSLTLGELGRSFFETTQKANAFKASMETISTAPGFSEKMWGTVSKLANDFGADVGDLSTRFSSFAVAANSAGVDMGSTIKIFRGMQTAMTAMHLDGSQQNQVGLAISQMMNKGYIASEEMNKQLNPIMTGAFAALDAAVKKASNGTTNAFDAMKKKSIDAKTGLLAISEAMSKKWGPSVAQALMAPQQQFNILKSRIFDFEKAIADAGAQEGFAKLLAKISAYLKPEDTKKYAEAIGGKLKSALESVGKALDYVYVNWDKIKGPLGTTLSLLGKWIVFSTAMKIGTTLVTPIIGLGRAAGVAVPLIFDLVRASKALMAVDLASHLGALSKIKSPAIVAGTSSLMQSIGGAGAGAGGLSSVVGGISKVPGLLKTATTAAGGFAAAIGTGLAVAWGIAGSAAAQSADGMATVNYSAGEIITGMWMTATETIASAWGKLTKWIGEAWDGAMKMVTDLGDWMTKSLGFNFSDIGTLAANTGFFIYYALKKSAIAILLTFQGLGKAIGATLSAPIEAALQVKQGNWTGAAGTLGKAALGITGAKALGDNFKGFDVSVANMRAERDQVGSGFNNLVGGLNAMGAKGRGNRPAHPRHAKEIDPFAIAPDSDDEMKGLLGHKAGGDKKKKAKKTPSLEDQENKVENAVDALMKKLSADDPIGKLYSDFVKNLTDEAHVLLSSSGYQTFLKNIKNDAKDGKVTVDSLIDSLQKGNLDAKTMNDLKARYGTDVKGIIELLKEQQADYEDSVKEATIKALDKKYKQVKAAAEVLGDSNPGLKAQTTLIDGLVKLGRVALNPDEFKDFATSLETGSMSSGEAVGNLIDRVDEAGKTSKSFKDLLAQLGMTTDQFDASILRLAASTKYQKQQSEEELTFGAKLMRTRQEQIALNSVSARDSELISTLQEEVNNQLKAGNVVTKEDIQLKFQQLKAQQDLADQMQRNKTFFENNGVRSYINDVKDAGAAVNDLDKNVLQSLDDQLYALGTTGKFSFKAIFDTIQQGIVRFASSNITKTITESLFPKDQLNGGTPSLFGGLFKATGLGDYKASTTVPLGSTVSNALWVQWTGQMAGGGLGGTGVGIDETNGNLYSGSLRRSSVTFTGQDATTGIDPMTPVGPLSPAASDSTTVAGGLGKIAANDNAVGSATAATAKSFQSSITSVLPMIGLAFAGSFKSPIAQVGALFLSTILTKMLSGGVGGAGGGGGGIGGFLGSIFGGGKSSGIASIAGALEGGITGSFVNSYKVSPSAFNNAPHYAEGTHNTSGGMPAILHDNEAVIPLSRGRKVPVQMNGASGTSITQNYNISTPDANSFRKSKQQIATDSYAVAARAFRRNH